GRPLFRALVHYKILTDLGAESAPNMCSRWQNIGHANSLRMSIDFSAARRLDIIFDSPPRSFPYFAQFPPRPFLLPSPRYEARALPVRCCPDPRASLKAEGRIRRRRTIPGRRAKPCADNEFSTGAAVGADRYQPADKACRGADQRAGQRPRR